MCQLNKKCNYHKLIFDSFKDISNGDKLELVIYECPKFKFND